MKKVEAKEQSMNKQRQQQQHHHRRRCIEDVPFYKIRQTFDELPLDPIRPFVLEKIQKMRSSRPSTLSMDLNLYSYAVNDGIRSTILEPASYNQMSQKNGNDVNCKYHQRQQRRQQQHSKSTSTATSHHCCRGNVCSKNYNWSWLNDASNQSAVTESRMKEATNQIIALCTEQRNVNFQRNARILGELRVKKSKKKADLKKNETITVKWPMFKYKPGDELKLRKSAERQRELKRMSDVIDGLIANKLRGVKRQKTTSDVGDEAPAEQRDELSLSRKTSTNGCGQSNKPLKKRKSLTNEEFLINLKMKEKSIFRSMQCLQPVDPDTQKMRYQRTYERTFQAATERFSPDIEQRTIHLLKHIAVTMIEHYPTKWIIKTLPKIDPKRSYLREAHRFIKREKLLWPNVKSEIILMDYLFDQKHHVKESEAILIAILLMDLQQDFRFAIKRSVLTFLLSYEGQRKRLSLEMEPMMIEYPVATAIRGPVSWKCNFQIAKNRLDQVLMVNHPVLQAINYLWYQLYDDFIVFDTAKCYRNKIPLHFDVLTEMIHNCCMVARDILMNDWLPRVADLVDIMIDYWKDLVPMKSKDGGRGAILFRCIHALMSRQVRGLIERSLEHLYKTLDVYKEGNEVGTYDVNHPKLKRQPFMTLNIMVVGKFYDNFEDLPRKQGDFDLYKHDDNDDPNILPMISNNKSAFDSVTMSDQSAFVLDESGKLLVEPHMEELPELFVSYFKEILRVGYEIPRLEYYMSQDIDQFGYLHTIAENHVDMVKLYENMREIVAANQMGPKLYLYPIYTYYSSLFSDKIKLMTERIFEQDTIPSLPTFISFMEKMSGVIDESFFLTDYVRLNLFMLDCRRLNKVIATLLHEIKQFVTDYFKALNQKENRRICDEFEEMSMHAGERPKETAEVVALQNYLNECKEERIVKLKDEIKRAAERVVFLLYHATLDAEEIYLNSRTFLWPHELEQVLELSGARLSVVRENLEVALKERRTKFESYLLNERRKMETFRLRETKEFLSIDELKEKCDISDNFMEVLKKCGNEAEAINIDENLLQLEITAFPTLQEMIEKMDPIEKLWKTAYKFDKCHEIWYFGSFANLNGEEIRRDVESMSETILKLIKQLANNPQAKRIADQVRMKIDKFKIYLPILDAICQQGLNDRHWQLISNEIGQTVNPELFPTLSAMIDIDILRIADQLQEIANAAAKEYELNMQLTNMQTEWTNVRFELIQYRDSDAYILAGLDDVQSLLDDHILKSQSMRGSPFIAALGKRATDWEEKLINMQDIMDIWLKVQSTWMYLEPIFNSEDIMRQMPVEGRNFKAIDRTWREIMQNTNNDRRVIQSTDYPNLLQLLNNAFSDLEKVQKGLNTYLEKKRIFFARFFFLSNDEILEILSETKDPKRVQPHLRKCFEGINALKFDQNNEITALVSAEQEVLTLNKKINPTAANGLVEKWLKEVQTIMLESVLTQMKSAYDGFWTTKHSEWITKWCGQMVQTISLMTWTKETEEAISGNALIKYLTKHNEHIDDCTELLSGNLSPGASINIESLLILNINARDILSNLISTNIIDTDNFNWISQLRYYWKYDDIEKTDIISVCILWSDVRYGMEYLGNILRLIVTPQTDRCFRSVMGALKLGLSSMAIGPTGTGKTETLKDLTKAVGKKCTAFNCSPTLDYIVMGKFFKGLIQTGAWVIFYDFNCINAEVLSVVAQQLQTIQTAKAQRAIKVLFQETTLKLDASCNVFVVINPDYPVRHKLPDNLKSQFRPCAMLPLDIQFICEIQLYINGFKEIKAMARKIIQLHKLCSGLLTHYVEHYDFNVRTIKSILLLAQKLKRQQHQQQQALPECQILLNAIAEINLPKLVGEDLSMFKEICAQIFPNATLTVADSSSAMWKAIEEMLQKRQLQASADAVEKIAQIHKMLSVKNGIAIVGDAMTGKTTAWQTLAETLRAIKLSGNVNSTEYEAVYRVINPKSISMDQLYGYVDELSLEWCDGVLAKVFRELAAATTAVSPSRAWIIFDGIVDPLWMDCLHTLLDDNRKLCLASGEMIEKTPLMSMIFETNSLEHATPATVARCGIVYISQSNDWRNLHASFVGVLQRLGLVEIYITLFETLIDWLIPAILEILRDCNGVLKITPTQQYQIFRQFFEYFVKNQQQLNQIWFQQTLLYCIAWAYGSTLLHADRKVLDHRLRKVLHGSNDDHPKPKLFTLNRGQMFPEKMIFTEYRFDGIETWWPWLKSEDVSLPASTVVSTALIPTKETNSLLYWINLAMTASIPILLIGQTGTGKSATVRHFLNELPKDKFMNCVLNLAANTSAQQVQEMVMSKLDRRRKGVFGPPVGKSSIIFADNVGIPSRDECGSQPSIELMRQWIDHKYWSDLKDTSKVELVDLLFVGAMGLTGGKNYSSPRFYRHAFLFAIDTLEMSTIQRIFTGLCEWHFSQGFSDKISMLAKGVALALCSFYEQTRSVLLPTPEKFLHLFSLRDIFRIFEGITLVPAKKLQSPEKLMRLWAHETYRVYSDRLHASDQKFLLDTVSSCCKANFKVDLSKAFGKKIPVGANVTTETMRNLVFGNFMEPDAVQKTYDEIDDWQKLEKIINYYLNEFNSTSDVPMDLVLFKYSIEHICRISRALQIPQGHLIAVGYGGSGRKTSVKLAATMSGAELFQFEFTRDYSLRKWRDDIKKVLMTAGMSEKGVFFLYSDSNRKDSEAFMNDIVTLMDVSELPNLFQSEDKAKIMDAMQAAAKKAEVQVDTTPAALYKYFVERVRINLHIALAISPINDNLRKYLHCYPSLLNYCTIDGFTPWPQDALQSIAEKFIGQMSLSHPKLSKRPSDEESSGENNKEMVEPSKPLPLSKFELSLMKMMVIFNDSVTEASSKLFKEFGCTNFVTPSTFFEMLNLFKALHHQKHLEITTKRERYTNGLEKLDSAASQVGDMQQKLFDLQPRLKQLSDETEQIMVKIERDTAEAEKKKEVVGADESAANESAAAAQAIKDDCDGDLQEAIPAFNSALAALNTLKPPDITIVKSMKNPPAAVKLVLEAVCVIRAIKPDRKSDPSGKIVEDYWSASLKMLSDLKFLENLKTFDKDNIPVPTMKRIREKYISDRDFHPDKVKNVSTACEGLCKWIRAMDIYDRVAKIVAPKQQALALAEAELADQMEKLNSKRNELQIILDKLQGLNDFFAEKSKQKKNLEDEIDNCEKKLDRAETLLGGLGGEKTRWSEIAAALRISLDNVIGDVLLASAFIAYLGRFPAEYRQTLLSSWIQKCIEFEIPCTETFTLSSTLSDSTQIRTWTLSELPVDNHTIENAIISKTVNRYPLMIDPQDQANKWIKNIEKENDLKVIKCTDENYLNVIADAIVSGTTVLVENIHEIVDSALYTILQRNIVRQKTGQIVMKCGDKLIEYNDSFRLYITTILPNPSYSPEIASKITLIDFTLTEEGIKQKILSTIIAEERIELQKRKENYIIESAKNRDLLYKLESNILEVLSTSEGNILEDENAINILSTSKTMSDEIQAKQVTAVSVEQEIDAERQTFLVVAEHTSVLYFCVMKLKTINYMYQYSLEWFMHQFVQNVRESPKRQQKATERMLELNENFTKRCYQQTIQTLYEKDRLAFAFLIFIEQLRTSGKVDDRELEFLLSDAHAKKLYFGNDTVDGIKISFEWLSDPTKEALTIAVKELPSLCTLLDDISNNEESWRNFYADTNQSEVRLPQLQSIGPLAKLVIIKCMRPDKILMAVENSINEFFSETMFDQPATDVKSAFCCSTPTRPIIYMKSIGGDEVTEIFDLAQEKNMIESCKTISMGQDQGMHAEKLISDGMKHGNWIIFENCCLAIDWMPKLEILFLKILNTEEINEDFRLWFVTESMQMFPLIMLRKGIQIVNEPPREIAPFLLKQYSTPPLNNDKYFNNAFPAPLSLVWHRSVFALNVFHAVAQTRNQFVIGDRDTVGKFTSSSYMGPALSTSTIGWSTPYSFNEDMLKCSVSQLRGFLKQSGAIPFDSFFYLLSECYYGSEVIDHHDRRLLFTLLQQFCCETATIEENYKFFEDADIAIPKEPNKENCIDYLKDLPLKMRPNNVGLHENAQFGKDVDDGYQLLRAVFRTQTTEFCRQTEERIFQPTTKIVQEVCSDILKRLPLEIEAPSPHFKETIFTDVLRRERKKYNTLLRTIKLSLQNISSTIKGLTIAKEDFQQLCTEIASNEIPRSWRKRSYRTTKTLGSFINDLVQRIEFFQRWSSKGIPNAIWFSALYFPQALITAIKYAFCKRLVIDNDDVLLDVDVTSFDSTESKEFDVFVKDARKKNENSIAVYGLFMEGAKWSREKHCIDEADIRRFYDKLPVLMLTPDVKKDQEDDSLISVPIYRTAHRRGVTTKSGHSTSFVATFNMQTEKPAKHWIGRGVALLCELSD